MPTAEPSTPDVRALQDERDSVRAQLAATHLLGRAEPQMHDELAQRVHQRRLRAGEVLCTEGHEGTSAFLVTTGRFRVERNGRDVGVAGRGELIGEMSLLNGQSRVATVTALRDAAVLVISASTFDEVLSQYPDGHRALSRQLVDRLSKVVTSIGGPRRCSVLTVLHDGTIAARSAMSQFVEYLGSDVPIVTTDKEDLQELEARNELAVLAPDQTDPSNRAWALSHSDRVLVFADSNGSPSSARDLAAGISVEVVLVHPSRLQCPSATQRWLHEPTPSALHHVRRDNAADSQRLVRRITDQEIVLVLSGGGARGMAHLGLWAAMVDQGLPIDAVVGVSAGSVAGATIAMGADHVEGARLARRLFAGRRGPIDLTVPTVALASGSRMNERLQELCHPDRRIEDLWLPLTVVSTNLSTGEPQVHRSGRLWRALRASTAIPGVFPPVPEPEGLLVDGGVLANMPISLARQIHPGATIIASDVGKKMGLSPDGFPTEAEIGGWAALRQRLSRRRGVHNMISVLAQVTAVGGSGADSNLANLYLDFDLDRFAMFDFRRAQAIIDAGRQQANPKIEDLAHSLLEPDETAL